MKIKLYELCGADETHLFSPHCWKAKYALAHKGVEYETVPVPFTKVANIENGKATSGGNRKVPVLVAGEEIIEDSFQIAKWLDKNYTDKPSLMGCEKTMALTKFIETWSQTQLHPEVAKLALLDIYESLAEVDKTFFRQSREKMFGCTLEEFSNKFPKDNVAINKVLVPMQLMLKGQNYFGGEKPLFADYIIFGALQWLRLCSKTKIEIEGKAGEWFETMLDMYGGLGRSALKA